MLFVITSDHYVLVGSLVVSLDDSTVNYRTVHRSAFPFPVQKIMFSQTSCHRLVCDLRRPVRSKQPLLRDI